MTVVTEVQRAMRHRIVIIGGGTAGITVAARLRRAGQEDIAVIEPATVHAYQPLWTLVGGGRASGPDTIRPESSVMPRGVRWIQDEAVAIDPDASIVHIRSGADIHYDYLVVAPGIQLNWGKLPGVEATLGQGGVSSNYRFDLAPRTWEFIRTMRKGTAVFMQPSGPIKCAGAPQKIAYLAADWWAQQGCLNDIHIILALPTPTMFGVPEYARVLEQVASRYHIDVRLQHEVVEVRPDSHELVLRSTADDQKEVLHYDFLHAVPPQSAPDWLAASPVADPASPFGYVAVDRETLQHPKYPNVFSLGDASNAPTSKTGAAIRKEAPVVVRNLLAVMNEKQATARYDGYTSCPLVTSRNRMLLAEFDYTMRPHPTIPMIDTSQERYDMWLLKKYGLPFMYWNLMLKGLV